MKIRVDRSRCHGHALCAQFAPEIYEVDDDGYCISDGAIVPEDLVNQARKGVEVCPERCISLVE